MSDNNDQLLDETLDDLADLPSSAPFVTGSHLCDMFISRQDKKPSSYIVKFKHKSVLELANPADEPPKPGDEATLFIHTRKKDGSVNEIGQGQLKQVMTPVAMRLGTNQAAAVLEACNPKGGGVEVAITSGVKKQENYPDQMVLKKIELT